MPELNNSSCGLRLLLTQENRRAGKEAIDKTLQLSFLVLRVGVFDGFFHELSGACYLLRGLGMSDDM